MKRSALIIAVMVLGFALVSIRMSAQAPPSNDVNAALVRELHDLRMAIEKLASANTRIQVLSVSASQQEQRISALTNQLIALNGKLADTAAEASFTNSNLERIKEGLRVEADPKQRQALEDQQLGIAAALEHAHFAQSSAQAQVDALRQQIGVEQSNLADLQRRLEMLIAQ
jgi:chromosome segregation ATPase